MTQKMSEAEVLFESSPNPSPVKSGKHPMKAPTLPPAKKIKLEELQAEYLRKNITWLNMKIDRGLQNSSDHGQGKDQHDEEKEKEELRRMVIELEERVKDEASRRVQLEDKLARRDLEKGERFNPPGVFHYDEDLDENNVVDIVPECPEEQEKGLYRTNKIRSLLIWLINCELDDPIDSNHLYGKAGSNDTSETAYSLERCLACQGEKGNGQCSRPSLEAIRTAADYRQRKIWLCGYVETCHLQQL